MNSYRRIFRSSAITGGASVINIVIGIVKVKALAILLGPTGVGLMGLYQNIVSMAATLSAFGVGSSGVRQIAAASEDRETLSLVRRALWYGNLLLGLVGMLVLWLFRAPIADFAFGNSSYVTEVGLLGLGVFLTLIAGSQTALLQGLRKIGDLARVKIGSALVAAVVGIALVYWLGEQGVVWFVVAAPAGSVLVAAYYANKLPRPEGSVDWVKVRGQWRALLDLGVPSMFGVAITLAGSLIVRSIVMNRLGADAAGFYQAAWTISMTYIGFVLGAMNTDFYPRLVKAIADRSPVSAMINQQVEMSLLMVAPLLLTLLILSPYVVSAMYSPEFYPAVDILRWQLVGDVFKVASWSVALVFMACGRPWLSVVTQLIWNLIYVVGIYFGIGHFGLEATGFLFLIAYFLCLVFVGVLSKRLINYHYDRKNLLLIFIFFASALIIVNTGYTTTVHAEYMAVVAWGAMVLFCSCRLFKVLRIGDFLKSKGVSFR